MRRGQIEGCRSRHGRFGLPLNFLEEVDEVLRDAADLIELEGPPVILTGEYTPENFLLSRAGAGCRLSGLIDFGDVMTGRGEYDLLGPSVLMAGGMPRRVRSLFAGYGYTASDITPDLKRRLMALMLLHRFGNPAKQIAIEGWQQRPPISVNCRTCCGRLRSPRNKAAQNICSIFEQISLFVCNQPECGTLPKAG